MAKQLEYIVELPTEGVGVSGYDAVEKLGRTEAPSPKKAVSNLIFRSVNRDTGRLVMYVLNEVSGEDFSRYVHVVPEIDSEDALLSADYEKMKEYALAQELASGKTPEQAHLRRARRLMGVD